MKIDTDALKKQVILHLPYLLFLLVFAKLGEAVRLAPGADASQKLLGLSEGFSLAFQSMWPGAALDWLVGLCGAVIVRGRAQRELAADHPIKAVYNRRMNTILQSTRRGKLDAELAKVMKKLAKDKMLRAISDHSYASTRYEQEMTQEALLAEAKRRMAL